jgi:hypothetical protein
MKKLIVMVVLVCLSVVTFSAETNCAPANSKNEYNVIMIGK